MQIEKGGSHSYAPFIANSISRTCAGSVVVVGIERIERGRKRWSAAAASAMERVSGGGGVGEKGTLLSFDGGMICQNDCTVCMLAGCPEVG